MLNRRNEKSAASSSSSSSSSPAPSRPVEQTLLQDHFRCPILQKKMCDPVIAADGYTYEREAITQWIATRGARALSPMTGKRLAHLEIQDNILVRQMIAAYQDTKPQRQERALTEKDIELAIRLREEELKAMLEKQSRTIETIIEERDATVRQLTPQQKEIQKLKEENERLKQRIEKVEYENQELLAQKKEILRIASTSSNSDLSNSVGTSNTRFFSSSSSSSFNADSVNSQNSDHKPSKKRTRKEVAKISTAEFSSSSSSSSLSSSSLQPQQSALKSNQGLLPAQMELQNQLTKACYDADVDLVKELVAQGADPAIPDKDGLQPLAAAIWGLAFKVMDYLESKVNYTAKDWLAIARELQTRHNIVIPSCTKIVTYRDWMRHYFFKEAVWFYTYSECVKRAIDGIFVDWSERDHIKGLERYPVVEGWHVRVNTMTSGDGGWNYYDKAKKFYRQVLWYEVMTQEMEKRLEKHGVEFYENYCLIADLPNAPAKRW